MRVLEEEIEHDDHTGHDHGEIDHDEKANLTTIKIVIIICLLLAGLFVFFPYSQSKAKK